MLGRRQTAPGGDGRRWGRTVLGLGAVAVRHPIRSVQGVAITLIALPARADYRRARFLIRKPAPRAITIIVPGSGTISPSIAVSDSASL